MAMTKPSSEQVRFTQAGAGVYHRGRVMDQIPQSLINPILGGVLATKEWFARQGCNQRADLAA